MHTFEIHAAHVEQILNPIDWFPLISSCSGMVRILAGVVELAVAAAFVHVRCTDMLINCSKTDFRPVFIHAGYFSLHAFANIFRGAMAVLQATIALSVYDNLIGRFNYYHEELREGVYPLAASKKLAH